MARYAAEGADVHVIIATDGIAGSVEASTTLQDHETLAQVRSAELANAAVALGVSTIWSLPYRDSGMRHTADNEHPDALIQQPLPSLIRDLASYITRLQPQVIVTHDPWGGYGHPDHIRVCEAVTAAFYVAAAEYSPATQAPTGIGAPPADHYPGPQKLYYSALDKRLVKFFVMLMPLFGQDPAAQGRNKDINFLEISQWETPVTARIGVDDYFVQRLAASRAHTSQFGGGPGWLRLLPRFTRRRLMGVDSFSRAFPAPTGKLEEDLFEGVVF